MKKLSIRKLTNQRSPFRNRIDSKLSISGKRKNAKNRPKLSLEKSEKPELLQLFEKMAKNRLKNAAKDTGEVSENEILMNDLEPKLDSDRDNSRRIDEILSTNLIEKVNLNMNRPKKLRLIELFSPKSARQPSGSKSFNSRETSINVQTCRPTSDKIVV